MVLLLKTLPVDLSIQLVLQLSYMLIWYSRGGGSSRTHHVQVYTHLQSQFSHVLLQIAPSRRLCHHMAVICDGSMNSSLYATVNLVRFI